MIVCARSGVRIAGIAAAMLAISISGSFAPAGAAEGDRSWVSIGVLGGSTLVDGDLANYQWDTRPHAAYGVIALAGRGSFALGVRASRSQTTQRLSLPSAPEASAHVRSSTIEAIGRARVGEWLGLRVATTVSGGRLGMDYSPGSYVVPGAGTVTLAPVHSWIAGAGLCVEHPIAREWSATLAVDRQFHSLETAHRRGAEIVYERESLGTWNARLELARTFFLHGKGNSR